MNCRKQNAEREAMVVQAKNKFKSFEIPDELFLFLSFIKFDRLPLQEKALSLYDNKIYTPRER